MTTLDQNTPIPAKSLAEIEKRNERALKVAEDPAWSLDQAELDRAMLCAEVVRLASERDRLASAARDSDAYALDKELTEADAERADLANQVSVLRDHVAALESGTRAALAVDWDTLRAQIGNTIAAGTAGAFSSARILDEVMATVRKAVQP